MVGQHHPATLPAQWLAHRYDPHHDAVHFLQVPRAVRQKAPFLTDDNLPDCKEPLVIRRSDAVENVLPGRLNFIFHSAYCGSTLLANAYDRPGATFALKEPMLLNDLVGWRHRGGDPQRISEVLRDALRLMARSWHEEEVGVIKPSNVVNGLARAMIAARPEAGILLLYAPLEQYLGSIAAKGLWGRLWVRELLAKYLVEGLVDLDFSPQDYFMQSDLQVAAVGWLAQQHLFASFADAWPSRVRTITTPTLLAMPAEALKALDQLFSLADDPLARNTVIDTVFSRHSKFGTSFTATERALNQKSAANLYSEEIEKVTAWATVVAERIGIKLHLPQPLL